MATRSIRLFGDPVLKTVCKPVETIDAGVHALIKDLVGSVRLPGRAGVAANQIGVNLRCFSYNVDGNIGYLINPELLEVSGEKTIVDEGCLSVPDLWFPTPRYPFARAKGMQLDGTVREISGTGLMAQALQHEIDHLDGFVYLDRLDKQTRAEAMKSLRQTTWF